jgi:hypothetical protein
VNPLRHLQIDARLATLDDQQIQILWRAAVDRRDGEDLEPLVRQLVLRALPAIESACRIHGRRARYSEQEIQTATREASLKLMLRLLHKSRWRSLTALASQLAGEVIADPGRRRRTAPPRLATQRPALRLISGHTGDPAANGGGRA